MQGAKHGGSRADATEKVYGSSSTSSFFSLVSLSDYLHLETLVSAASANYIVGCDATCPFIHWATLIMQFAIMPVGENKIGYLALGL